MSSKTTIKISICIIIVISNGCVDSNSEAVKQELISKDTPQSIITKASPLKFDMGVFEKQLKMYNKSYTIIITPELNNEAQLSSNIILIFKKDTIFAKTITHAVLYENIKSTSVLKDSLNINSIQKDYYLVKTVFCGLRNDNLYFESLLNSNSGRPEKYILFQIKYLKNVGELFINCMSDHPRSLGTNEGDTLSNSQH
jgi:hypothetical protein